jgi:hypothetical protein
MFFSAYLNLEGVMYMVYEFRVELLQDIDMLGRTSSTSRGGKLFLQLPVTNEDVFADWMANPRKAMNGALELMDSDGRIMKSIEFTNGICVDFAEFYDANSEVNMFTEIIISAEKMKIGEAEINNKWPG